MATLAPTNTHDLRHGLPMGEALALFDSLPTVALEEMTGSWNGFEVTTGHPLDGMLERSGWQGKRFDGPEDVQPLVFGDGRGGVMSVNPALMPLGLLVTRPALARAPGAARLFRLLLPLMRTAKPRARLRMTEYRGQVSATMCYDALPIHDVFRRLDDDALLGLMDLRGADQPYVFVLERE